MMASILVVESDRNDLDGILTILNEVMPEHSARAAGSLSEMMTLLGQHPDLLITSDVLIDGTLELIMTALNELSPHTKTIITSRDTSASAHAHGLCLGAVDFLHKPLHSNMIKRSVSHAIQLKRLEDRNRILLSELARQQGNLKPQIPPDSGGGDLFFDMKDAMERLVIAMAAAIEIRDPWTSGHQKRVADLAEAIGRLMTLPDQTCRTIYLSGLVHDLGKLKVPAEILSYPGRLGQDEMNIIKRHPDIAFQILNEIQLPWPLSDIALQHHERLDGSGYPKGLPQGNILLESKIVAVADVVEAMASHRPYRPALGISAALEEVTSKKSILFDPDVVQACVALFREKGWKW